MPRKPRGREALLLGTAAGASRHRQGRRRRQQTPSAPSAWETSKRQPTWLIACTASALPASDGGPAGEMRARSAGSLWSSCCTRCKGTTTTRSTWLACPPACAGGWPWRGRAAGPRSSATTCAGGPPTTNPRLAEGGLRGLTAHRVGVLLRGPPTPPPSRLPHPALLGSQPHQGHLARQHCQVQASARLALLLLRTHAMARGSCGPSASASSASNKHLDAFQGVCVS